GRPPLVPSEQAGRVRGQGELRRELPARGHRGRDRSGRPGGGDRPGRGEHDPPTACPPRVITTRTRIAGSGSGRPRRRPRPMRTGDIGTPRERSRIRGAAWWGRTPEAPGTAA